MLTRKKMLQLLATAPFIGGLAGTQIVRNGTKLSRNNYRRNYINELGLRTFINARGTFTTLTGSLMEDEVVEAINFMSDKYVSLPDLRDRTGERIAEMLNCEASVITAGAASALTLGTAACITGDNQDMIRDLPNLDGPQREVIMQSTHRFGYDHAVRNCGIKIVEVDSASDMEAKINDNTVMALFFNAAREHLIGREEFVEICRRNNIPSFNDAAADVPPKENLFKYIEQGFDLVTFSGGKAIRGPQSAGLLYGRKDLIEAAKMNHSPNGNTIGRGMKVNKEEYVGMMVALEVYLTKDHDKEWQEWLRRVEVIRQQALAVDGVEAEEVIPDGPSNVFPGCRISWDEDRIKVSSSEVIQSLRNGHPSIEIGGGSDNVYANVSMMKSEEAGIVGRRIREELERASA